ncbi:spindle assembly checkpoint kinase [Cichlidogyrus casuarinus]|uniref:Spindle assembly checkpoint kinase n=1 Tax=Cichlidogyrus casuarinus TaxID=1844966 RepID=A0ABD2PNC1_9PLAT
MSMKALKPLDKDKVFITWPVKAFFHHWQTLHTNDERLLNVHLVSVIQKESAEVAVLKEERKQKIRQLGAAHMKSLLFEAKVTVNLKSHKNVVKTMYAFHTQSRAYLLLEFAGYPLTEYSLRLLRDEMIFREIASGILTGLIYLHDNKVIHRNMHPENIYIGCRNQVKIGGFYGARLISESGKMKSFVGEVPYMAPEMLRCDEQVRKKLKLPKIDGYDEKIDVWGLALILLYILLGKNYFEARHRDKGSTVESATKIIEEICHSKEHVDLKISGLNEFQHLQEWLKCMLVRDPEKRFAAKDLEKVNYLSTYDGVAVQLRFGKNFPKLKQGEVCVGFIEKLKCENCENYDQFNFYFKSMYTKKRHGKKCDFCRYEAHEIYEKPEHKPDKKIRKSLKKDIESDEPVVESSGGTNYPLPELTTGDGWGWEDQNDNSGSYTAAETRDLFSGFTGF